MERRGQIQELFGRLNHWGWTKWIQGAKNSERVKESTEDPRLGHPKTVIQFIWLGMDLKGRKMRSDLDMRNF